MVDQKTKTDMLEKIEEGEFKAKDLPAFLSLFCGICNESEDAQEEVSGWNKTLLLNLEDGDDIWIKVDNGHFECGQNKPENTDTTLTAPAEAAAQILIGEKDATAAYMAQVLRVEGELPDAVKLKNLIEIVREELED